jgi:GcrA cell cycle regulator
MGWGKSFLFPFRTLAAESAHIVVSETLKHDISCRQTSETRAARSSTGRNLVTLSDSVYNGEGPNMSWNDERVELLKKLWQDGLSASQIAAELGGVTRNAVIGKVHRLGLSGRIKSSTPSLAPRRPRTTPPAPSQPRPRFTTQGNAALAAPAPIAAPAPAPRRDAEIMPFTCERVTIMELRECMCRWPLGDPSRPDFRFCGARSNAGAPYCDHHARMAYQTVSDRRRERRVANG